MHMSEDIIRYNLINPNNMLEVLQVILQCYMDVTLLKRLLYIKSKKEIG